MRFGADHTGFSSSGLSLVIAHSPPLPSKWLRVWSKNNQSFPVGSVQKLPIITVRCMGIADERPSMTSRGLDQVSPLSSLEAASKYELGQSHSPIHASQIRPPGVRSMVSDMT